MRVPPPERHRARCLAIALAVVLGAAGATAEQERPFPQRADAIVGSSLLRTPPIDATRLCPGRGEHGPLARFVRGGPGEALIALSGPVPELDPRDVELLRGAAAARMADTIDARRAARAALRRALIGNEDRLASTCALLELARLELALGLHPEAAASATRARGRPGEAETPQIESANFLLAEALYLGGSIDRTIGLYLLMARSSDPRRASAARLRLADLRFEHGARADALEDYEALLGGNDEFGADPAAWGPRAVEAAIDADRLEVAERWLEELSAGAEDAPLALSIRLADVRIARGEIQEGRDLLATLQSRDPESPEAAIARIRLFDWELEAVSEAAAIRALSEEIERARIPGVASYARSLLARKLVAGGRTDEAMPYLVRVAYDRTVPDLARSATESLGRALAEASARVEGDHGCSGLIERVADRQSHLLRGASEPAPFLVLGGCYERYRLPLAALEVYRGMARRFGARVAGDVALPIARTSFSAGEVGSARAAAELNLAAGDDADPGWRRLAAEARIADGAAAESIQPLIELSEAEGDPELLALLARAATLSPESEAIREALNGALSESEGIPPERAVIGLIAADLHRRAGDTYRARELFGQSLSGLSGPLRAEARYWWRRLGGTASEPPEVHETERRAAFAALAAEQSALAKLRERLDGEVP